MVLDSFEVSRVNCGWSLAARDPGSLGGNPALGDLQKFISRSFPVIRAEHIHAGDLRCMFNVQPPSGRVCWEMGSQIATTWTLQAILTSAATCLELLVSTARVRVPRGSGLFCFPRFWFVKSRGGTSGAGLRQIEIV